MLNQKKIPDPSIPQELIDGLFDPTIRSEDLNLADFIQEVSQEITDTPKISSDGKVDSSPNIGGIPVPLTPKEAEFVREKIDETIKRSRLVRDRITSIRKQIDETVAKGSKGSGQEFSIKMDISKRPQLKRAIKKLFGIKTNTVTYSMYQDLLAAKKTLEKQEVDGYLTGFEDEEA